MAEDQVQLRGYFSKERFPGYWSIKDALRAHIKQTRKQPGRKDGSGDVGGSEHEEELEEEDFDFGSGSEDDPNWPGTGFNDDDEDGPGLGGDGAGVGTGLAA